MGQATRCPGGAFAVTIRFAFFHGEKQRLMGQRSPIKSERDLASPYPITVRNAD